LGADPTRGVELEGDDVCCGVFSLRSCSAARRRTGEGDTVERLGVPSFRALLMGLFTPSADGDAGATVRGDRRTSECTIAAAGIL
jgi:hypothetical protein